MFPYNAQQRQQPESSARPEAGVQYHYSPQAQAAQQQQARPGQQVQPQGHYYPQQYPYYQDPKAQQAQPAQQAQQAQQPQQAQQAQQQSAVGAAGASASAPQATPPAGQATPTAGQAAAPAAAAGQAAPLVAQPMDQQYMQHMVPAMGYHQLYQAQAQAQQQQQQQGQSQEYPYGYRPNDYVFMMPQAAQMQVPGQSSQMVTQTVTDPTGQAAPPGIKPKVSTTLWEDENTLCFQVEARGICVARREDNDMVNGTKLLNVAGMTRGRRDGLLKGERNRHVVKAGAMHLKGVWIPYDRALDFANKERIIDLLYPLFVTDIKSVLYHPNQREGQPPVPAPVAAPPAVQAPQQPVQPQAEEKKEKEYYPQQQQYYYPQGQEYRQYQQGQPQYYAGQEQAPEEEQS